MHINLNTKQYKYKKCELNPFSSLCIVQINFCRKWKLLRLLPCLNPNQGMLKSVRPG
jgi:hypothetical protein